MAGAGRFLNTGMKVTHAASVETVRPFVQRIEVLSVSRPGMGDFAYE
jgi:hypothetical protein